MKRHLPSTEPVEISSDDSSDSETDIIGKCNEQPDGEPSSIELSAEDWLLRTAKSYQEYMKLLPVPKDRKTVIPYNSWIELGRSIKEIYKQPLHYYTNMHLKTLDQSRLGAEDEYVPLDSIIHPKKAEAIIWMLEEAHRLTTSHRQLHRLWLANPKYHDFIDDINPKLG